METNQGQSTDLDQILRERGERYGKFEDHADVTQSFKCMLSVHLKKHRGENPFCADQQEALDMIFHKIGRIVCGDPDYSDSWRDIAGYARLVADRLDGIKQ